MKNVIIIGFIVLIFVFSIYLYVVGDYINYEENFLVDYKEYGYEDDGEDEYGYGEENSSCIDGEMV